MEMCLDLTSIPTSRPQFLYSLEAGLMMFGKINGLGWVADKDFKEKQILVTTVLQVYF